MVSEEISVDMLYLVLPVLGAVILVMGTVGFVFWLGWGNQRSYEEAKEQASRKAEEVLREKSQVSPRAKKPRRPFSRKKKSEEHQEEIESAPPRKGILKTPSAGAEGRLSPNKVEFKLDTPAAEEEKTPRLASPPTPYPNKVSPTLSQQPNAVEKTPQPIFEEPEPEETPPPPEPKPAPAPKSAAPKKKQASSTQGKAEKPPQPPVGKKDPEERVVSPEVVVKKKANVQSAAPPSSTTSSQKKGKSSKAKGPAVADSPDSLPSSRISDIVVASPLTDEEIQWLIAQLLEKSKANSEWEAPNLKAESNKALKKQNQELQTRLDEALKSVSGYTTKIKDLRKEVQAERARCQSLETASQTKITQQSSELNYFKTRASKFEEEIKQVKMMSEAHNLQKLRDENTHLSTQVGHLQQQVKQLNGQLSKAKEDLKTPNPADAGLLAEVEKMKEKCAEMDNLMHRKNHELEKYSKTIQDSHNEIQRLKKQIKGSEAQGDKDALEKQVTTLQTAKAELEGKLQEAAKSLEGVQAEVETLRGSVEKARKEGQTQVRAELEAKHREEVDRLQKSLVVAEGAKEGEGQQEEELRKRLAEQAARCTSLEDQVTELTQQLQDEGKKGEGQLEEQKRLLSEQTAKSSSLEQQVTVLSQQLKDEQASKKEALKELETERLTKATPNGSVEVEPPLSNGGEQQAAALEARDKEVSLLEKKLEDLKSKNNELNESLWKAKDEAGASEKSWEKKLKQAQEQAEVSATSAKTQALREAYETHRTLLQQLFPQLEVKGCDGKYQQWLEKFETQAQELISTREKETESLKEQVEGLEKEREENIGEIKQFRDTLEATMGILQKLQSEVQSSTEQHQTALEEKDAALKAEQSSKSALVAALEKEKALVSQVREELRQEKEVVSQVREELEGANGKEEAAQLEQRLQEVEQSRKDMEKQVNDLHKELAEKEEAYRQMEESKTAETKLKEEAVLKSNQLEEEKKAVSEKLETMKQSNRELNARIGSLLGSSATDSEV